MVFGKAKGVACEVSVKGKKVRIFRIREDNDETEIKEDNVSTAVLHLSRLNSFKER